MGETLIARWANAVEVKTALEAMFLEMFGSKEAEQKARAEASAAAAKAKKVSYIRDCKATGLASYDRHAHVRAIRAAFAAPSIRSPTDTPGQGV